MDRKFVTCNIVCRWTHKETFQPIQRLVHLGFLKSSMDSATTVSEVFKGVEKLKMDLFQDVVSLLVVYVGVHRLTDRHNMNVLSIPVISTHNRQQ